MLNKLLVLGLALMLTASTALANESALRGDHPDRYVVQAGDTLWDIAERFLNTPWLWPEIWHANPQVENPHLIYPGDVISLVYIDGQPRLTMDRGRGETVRLSPGIREVSRGRPIPTINLADLEDYLTRSHIVDKDELDALPYVIAFEQQKPRASTGDRVYVRNVGDNGRQRYAVARPGVRYREVPANMAQPWLRGREIEMRDVQQHSGMFVPDVGDLLWENVIHHTYFGDSDIIGYELTEIGEVELISNGDPATFRVTYSGQELRTGDVLMPIRDMNYDDRFELGIPDRVPDNARILALRTAENVAGIRQVVALNMGYRHGVEPGHVLNVMRPGEEVRDEVRYPRGAFRMPRRQGDEPRSVTLPDEYTGQVMVFRAFDRVSYAIVVRAIQPVRVHDRLHAPDRLD